MPACLFALSALVLGFFVWFGNALPAAEDPYLEYEKTDSPEAIAWVRVQNAKTTAAFTSDPKYQDLVDYQLKLLNSNERIIFPSMYRNSDLVRNFWRDESHPQGIIRQTTLERFFSKDYQWETVFDLDAVSRNDGVTWVFNGSTYPFKNTSRAMIALSDGGKDAVEYREYDFSEREFVADGFHLPESKSDLCWMDSNTLLVSSAMTEEEQTDSGYPRVLKIWKRGQPFQEAVTVFQGEKKDLSLGSGQFEIEDDAIATLIIRALDFYNSEIYFYSPEGAKRINIPTDANLASYHQKRFFIWLKSDWRVGEKTFKQGSIVFTTLEDLLTGPNHVKLFYEPPANVAVEGFATTNNYIYLTLLEDVQSRIFQYRLDGDSWSERAMPVPANTETYLYSAPKEKGFILINESGFLTPTQLFRVDEDDFEKTLVQSLPERFDPSPYIAEQAFAISADGTRIPYFIVRREDMSYNGANPTLLYGYGGFLESITPSYLPVVEHNWLRDGGVHVLANIRGGGEYGPNWHEQARKGNRHKAFEDFIAVSEDLISRKITDSAHLGIMGGSNGGLLTGSVMVMRPDLYNAAIISVPLLDMLRYTKLPPGASWIGEYGDPDIPEERAYLLEYSPYQNLKPGVSYPVPFLTTSSKDDRVNPAHARKFAKRMEEYGDAFYYYEDLEGGHGGLANYEQYAKTNTLDWIYLRRRLMSKDAK